MEELEPEARGEVEIQRSDGVLSVRLAGSWTLRSERTPASRVVSQLGPDVKRVTFDTAAVTEWDSGLLTFLVHLHDACEERSVEVDVASLPDGVRRLLALAFAVPEKEGTGRGGERQPFLARIGNAVLEALSEGRAILAFVGESVLAFGRLVAGRAHFQRSDLTLTLQETGAQAFGIVSLISFLVGLILAFIGAVQLELFGAEIYVANLVTIGMAREMGAMMAAIVMAGRTGAAFAAQLGTMTVNEEIDSLETFGFRPMDFLVLPRMLALILMMPLLAVYADLMGILGGAVVGIGLLDITPQLYWNQTVQSARLMDFAIGIFKGGVFGTLIAIAGCMRGMTCGRSASAVGEAATSAVVTGIVLIIVFDALFAVATNALGI